MALAGIWKAKPRSIEEIIIDLAEILQTDVEISIVLAEIRQTDVEIDIIFVD